MKIVYYSRPSFADCDFPLIRALRLLGHDVYYLLRLSPFSVKSTLLGFEGLRSVCDLIPASEWKELQEWHEWIDINKSYVSNDCVGKTGFKTFLLYLKERRLIKRINPDGLLFVGDPMVLTFPLIRHFRRMSVCVIHDPIPHYGDDSFRNTISRKLLARIAPKIVLLNKHQTDEFCSKYGFRKDKIYYSTLGPYECYKHFQTGRVFSCPHVILFGRLSPYKGIDYALKAFSMIHEKHPEVKLIVAGAGPVCFDWDSYSHTGYVELINRYLSIQEIADYVGKALFLVCPYTDATQSGVLQTSFALGTPAVVTSVGTMPDVVVEGKSGLIVPPKDSDSLAKAFDSLLSDSSRLEGMRRFILEEVNGGDNSWKHIADCYINVFIQ